MKSARGHPVDNQTESQEEQTLEEFFRTNRSGRQVNQLGIDHASPARAHVDR